jgi:crotonobetainyl-CoA:carnitine CoA-transferase CaiB-like acyl-CoA transferase
LGLAYEDFASRHPQLIYLSVSGFGNRDGSPYRDWPALAPVVEAMSGIYEMRRPVGRPPVVGPMGAVGDVAAALFATSGVLSALRHRDRTGQGQMVDIAMLDATVAITDIVTNLWSLGLRDGSVGPLIMDGFRASDGWFVLQVIRENQFETLSKLIGHSEWISDPRFASRDGWVDHLDSEIRPAVEAWAAGKSKQEACVELAAAGLAGGPCLSPEEVAHDPHLEARHMIVAIPRTDGEAQPVLVPGNPVKLSKVQEGPENVPPTLGQDTDAVLGQLLGMSPDEIEDLRTEGVL